MMMTTWKMMSMMKPMIKKLLMITMTKIISMTAWMKKVEEVQLQAPMSTNAPS